MFNLSEQVRRLQQLKHDRVYGLPYKRRTGDPKVQHVDGTLYEIDAEQESMAMVCSFHNHSLGFGRRLSKAKGEKHHPGGGCHIGGYWDEETK